MPALTKITLSAQELQLVHNGEWILTKRGIIDKAVLLFGELSDHIKKYIDNENAGLPLPVVLSSPKISRGENYRSLPYVILDYPRSFEKDQVFAVRTMFWWGNFFSCTLQLSGGYLEMYREVLKQNVHLLMGEGFYISTGTDPWQHHFEKDHYTATNKMQVPEMYDLLEKNPFMKIAMKFPLQDWNAMPGILERAFAVLISLLKT